MASKSQDNELEIEGYFLIFPRIKWSSGGEYISLISRISMGNLNIFSVCQFFCRHFARVSEKCYSWKQFSFLLEHENRRKGSRSRSGKLEK